MKSRCISEGKTVAIMQPYFFPYGGYFRLFQEADHFVIYDCVQFPKRGRVHRSEVARSGEGSTWLTLPLARPRRTTLIRDLTFSSDARASFDQRLSLLPWVRSYDGPMAKRIREFLFSPLTSVIDYLEASLRLVRDVLSFETSISRSSTLDLSHSLRGQNRVIAAARAVGASRYVNSPGGRSLYDAKSFAESGIELRFLPPYQGRFIHLLPALMTLSPDEIRDDIVS